MDRNKLIRETERKALKAYLSGESFIEVSRRFGYSRTRLNALIEDYKSGKIDMFGPTERKKFERHLKEVDQLRARIAILEKELKEYRAKVEQYKQILKLTESISDSRHTPSKDSKPAKSKKGNTN